MDSQLLKRLVKNVSLRYSGDLQSLVIDKVFTDSRKRVEHGLFIPLVGDNFDGHDYLMDAVEAGAEAAIWQEDKALPANIPEYFPLFLVNDTLKALQDLAKAYLRQLNPFVIAITGSNGKTTTKDIIESVCRQGYTTFKTQGNFNNHIGLPLTVLGAPYTCDVLILEMGMNHFGEIEVLSRMARPDLAIITNIGESHIEFLGSRKGIAKAKLEIIDGFTSNSRLIMDGDEPLLVGNPKLIGTSVTRCGYDEANAYHITQVQSDIGGYTFTINNEETYKIPLLGKHNVKNATYGVAVGKLLKLTPEQIQKGFDELKVTGMRLETKSLPDGTTLINDAYNASPSSMKAAIQTVKALPGYTTKICVLGDMYELGPDEETLHRNVAEAVEPPISQVITVGPRAKWIADELQKQGKEKLLSVEVCETKEAVLSLLKPYLGKDTIILFKASRAIKLETLVQALCS